MPAIQVKRLHRLDGVVVQINMDNGVVVRWAQTFHPVAQDKQLIYGLRVPGLEHIR